jgi:predicted acyl esterase
MPNANHIVLRGHRIMVRIQSSRLPLYDRNRRTYVPNIFFAQPADYRAASEPVFRRGDRASAVWLPIVPLNAAE